MKSIERVNSFSRSSSALFNLFTVLAFNSLRPLRHSSNQRVDDTAIVRLKDNLWNKELSNAKEGRIISDGSLLCDQD